MVNFKEQQLSVGEAIGQVIMPRLDFNETGHMENSVKLVRDYNVGGFIIFNGKIEQVREAVLELKSISKYPLLFGCDAERGLGQIVSGATKFPFLMSHGAADNNVLLEKQAEITAEEMRYAGMNLIFAPVLDINSNPNNPIINVRAFGDDPMDVIRHSEIFIKKAKKSGLLTCGKHFPGHGSTDIDSHISLPEIDKDLPALEKLEFLPFVRALEIGVELIMVGHIAVPEIDGRPIPAIMSKSLVGDILKDRLRFSGVAITDSFRMDALENFGDEYSIALESIMAGCDIILDPKNPVSLLEKIKLEINDNEMLLSKIEASSQTVINLKENLSEQSGQSKPLFTENKSLINEISAESVCIVKEGRIDTKSVEINLLDITGNGLNTIEPFTNCLETNGIVVNKINYITENEQPEYRSVNNIIYIVITTVAAWSGNSQLNPMYKRFLEKIPVFGSSNILVSLGSPYTASGMNNFDTVVCSFDSLPECQVAVAENLLGIAASAAKLPVKI